MTDQEKENGRIINEIRAMRVVDRAAERRKKAGEQPVKRREETYVGGVKVLNADISVDEDAQIALMPTGRDSFSKYLDRQKMLARRNMSDKKIKDRTTYLLACPCGEMKQSATNIERQNEQPCTKETCGGKFTWSYAQTEAS